MTRLGRTLGYQYDAAGRRTRVTHPDGFFASYEYNAVNQLVRVSDSTDATLASFTYDDLGRRAGIGRGAGASTEYEYSAGRLYRMTHDLGGATYDSNVTFAYTPSMQITERTQANDAMYGWIPLAAGATSANFNGLNQLSQFNSTSVNHDQLGNLTTGSVAAEGNWTYGYDSESRLRSASLAAHTVSIDYDPTGMINKLTSAGNVTEFLYDGLDLVIEYDSAGAIRRRFVHGPGMDEPLAYYEGATYSDANRRFFHADERGSIVALSDSGGAGQSTFKYSPYGESVTLGDSRFGYTGQVWIETLGLYYYKARFYSPKSGRFIQPDPIGYGGGPNLYAYVGGDPGNRSDPLGLDEETIEAVIVTGQRYPFMSFDIFGSLTGSIAPEVGVESTVDGNDTNNGTQGKNLPPCDPSSVPSFDFSSQIGLYGAAGAGGKPLGLKVRGKRMSTCFPITRPCRATHIGAAQLDWRYRFIRCGSAFRSSVAPTMEVFRGILRPLISVFLI